MAIGSRKVQSSMFGLETERLLIRPWRPEDRPVYEELARDREVMRYIHAGDPQTEEEIGQFFERQSRQLSEYGMCMGAMVEKESGAVVGLAGIQPLGTTGDLEIGWVLSRHVWGRGYATEAGREAMRYVLDVLGKSRVVAIIDPENAPSKRVAARLGMVYDRRATGVELGHRQPEIVVDLFVGTKS